MSAYAYAGNNGNWKRDTEYLRRLGGWNRKELNAGKTGQCDAYFASLNG
jgi:hypothetical protein